MTDIYMAILSSFIGGLLIGWYPTFCHYRAKEQEQEAVRKALKAHIDHEKVKNPPPTDWQEAIDIIAQLNNSIVDEYHIILQGEIYEMRPIEEPENNEQP